MSLDTDTTTLDDVDLTAEIPCAVDDCTRPATWRGNPTGCPHRHHALLCDRHTGEHELTLIVLRTTRQPLRLECAMCSAPLYEPFIVWERL